MKNQSRIAAVIDIGSNELRLNIAETAENDQIRYLESLSYPLSLGRDTFHAGRMSFDKVDKACEIIKNFLRLTKDYDVTNIRTIASTAMREAANVDYIIDQIKIKTGVDVNVIDDLDEKRYIYKLLTHCIDEELQQSALVVYIGTGNMGVSLFVDGKMPRTWNIRVGSLRMGELFGQLQEYTRDFYKLMEEYLSGYTYKIHEELFEGINHFIVSGREIDTIARLVLDNNYKSTPLFDIPRQDFESFYEVIKRKTPDRIISDYKIDADKADSILPASCIYHNLLGYTSAENITVSRMLPSDAILFEMLYPKQFNAIDKRFTKGTILSARALAERHDANIPHCEIVQNFALMIFDKVKKIHGLGSRDKLLLLVAALLHDIGEVINNRDHHKMSYSMVRGSDLVGISQAEQEIIALICRYHSATTPDLSDPCYAVLDSGTKVRVSKLVAMLRLADALDRSHTQKYQKIDVLLANDELIITINTLANISLEQWSFTEKSRFFEEVFGIKAYLRVKKL